MKLPHAPARVMSLTILATILAATIALPAPARAQTYDPSYPVCLQIYQSIADFYYECRYQTMAQCAASASGRTPSAWSIHILPGRRPSAASVSSGIENRFASDGPA